jgi:succinate dehydrogenase/fumarate reductase flavoprotein subunit
VHAAGWHTTDLNSVTKQDVDLLVLGGGMAGLSAAAWSARQGRSVVLVEKAELGGNARHAGFIWTAPTLDALREAVPDGDPRLQTRLIEGFAPAVDWVRSLGVEVQPAVSVLRFGRGHQTSILNYLRACELAIRESPGCEILRPAQAEGLLIEDGEVRGAVVGGREIRAASTLLATGGFHAAKELRSTLIHENARDMPVRGVPHNRGDGLRLGRAAGGRFGPEDAGFYGHLLPSGIDFHEDEDFPALTLFQSEHGILVNVEGRRFVDETLGDHLTTLALLRQPEARGLIVSDARIHEEWILRPYVEGLQAVDRFDACYRRGARAAIAADMDELEHMPPEWGYDGAAVKRALLEYNAGNFDPPRRFDTAPIDRPPFYVIEALPAITFTFGGLLIDDEARVLDHDGRPIPGLLAAGADAGGLYVRAYAGGLAAALVFGLRAAQTALDRAGVPA